MTKDASYSIVTDAAGNALQRSATRVHVYDDQGRLSQVLNPTALYADFRYNALGQRSIKRTYLSSGALDLTITHLYGADGQLLGQVRYNNLGQKTSAQYWIWLDGMPLAEVEFKYNSAGAITSTGKYYLHSDHLNTPRLATNQAQTLLWSWDSDAFGLGTPNTDVDGDGVLLDIPLRFPGQVFEAYSNLNYNYFRDYDPNTGRYVQSDPIGLDGGMNTYGYVNGNPLSYIDPFGLVWKTVHTDYHGVKNWSIAIIRRISTIDDGTVMSPKDCAGCTRDVVQEWVPDPQDPPNPQQRTVSDNNDLRRPGERRRITQTFNEGDDTWNVDGKSWYWSPYVPDKTWGSKF
jgi:RHS repeat-associated protein